MKVQQDLMFLRLSFGLPRQSRKVDADSDVDKSRLRASAKLYTGEAFASIKALDAVVRATVVAQAISIPSGITGCYVLPYAMVETVNKYLTDGRTKRNQLVSAFLADDYDRERVAAMDALGGQFRDSDFPDAAQIIGQFRMEWQIFRLEVPASLPDDVRQAELAKYRENVQTVYTECRDALRVTMADLVGHLADRLAPDADGGRKRLAKTTVENLREFMDTLDKRDITSDDELKALSAKARAVLCNYSADDLKSVNVGNQVRQALTQVKSNLDTLITRDQGRKIDLDL